MRALLWLILAAGTAAAAPRAPGSWLVIKSVDKRGRRPFNPDTIFERYLLDPHARPPRVGEEVKGSLGTQRWEKSGSPITARIAYAYAAVESDREQVVLARAPGGARLYVNGDAFVADIYRSKHDGVPVLLHKGTNHVYLRGTRGKVALEFVDVVEGVLALGKDATLPDAVEGEPVNTLAGIVVVNASMKPVGGFAPLGVRKFGAQVRSARFTARGRTFELKVRKKGAAYRRTFVSDIDGSVQEYSVLPPVRREGAGLVLTLHGAGVPSLNQARAYSRKENLWIVAPTNRRPFGFDWQDWGRADAYEVLEDALALTAADESRLYLTGHSMGGHGTWHLAANDPDRFAAIAPSAGWATFDTYVGRPKDKLDKLWRGADGASDTLGLLPNLVDQSIFILHGAADKNVPAREAVLMETLLIGAGSMPHVHYQPKAGHWWNGKAAKGADCVDWPGIFKLFAKSRRPVDVRSVEFTSADPAVDSRHYWIRLLQPLRYGEPMWVRAFEYVKDGGVDVWTRNVRRFAVERGGDNVTIDGRTLKTKGEKVFFRTKKGWQQAPANPKEKNPDRSGPFKRAFDNRFVFVYGDEQSMKRARFDAQTWWYRGNGDVPVVSDKEFLADGYAGRNAILYGNASTNKAWVHVFGKSCPIQVENGVMSAGDRVWYGDEWACVFVYPRQGESRALAGAFAHTGARGARVGYTLMPFTSGVGYPDYAIFSTDVLTKGDAGVSAAGWFNHDWSLPR